MIKMPFVGCCVCLRKFFLSRKDLLKALLSYGINGHSPRCLWLNTEDIWRIDSLRELENQTSSLDSQVYILGREK